MKKIAMLVKTFLFLLLILFMLGNYCYAEIYKYKDENGIWYFTDNPVGLDEENVQIKSTRENERINKDLQKQLSAILPQRNVIEKATFGVVAVKSSIGYGSGFFITDDGYIITNKHVLKGAENQKKTDQDRIDNVKAKLKEVENHLNKEGERLEATREKLEREKKFIDSQPKSSAKRNNLEQYEYYLNSFKEWENDFKERKKQFSEQENEINNKISEYNYDKAMAEISRYFKILIADDTELDVYLVSTSNKYDLALLKLDGYKTPFLRPADPWKVAYGETVYAVGNPAELRNSVAKGILSGIEENYIKTDAKIYPGNSGGPLITEDGKVIGINTFKKLTRKFEGLGFAVPIQTAIDEFRSELGNLISLE